MPSFQYTARTAAGDRVAGVLAGASEQAALAELESRRLTPVTISEARASVGASRRVPVRALAGGYQQLADLLSAGVPLLRSLKVLGGRRTQPRLSSAFRDLGEAVAQGQSLADAMEARPDTFPRIHVAMVRAGEAGGFLESVLGKLGKLVGAQAEMRSKIAGNMVYPAVLVVFGLAVLGVVFGFFVPKFEPLFARLGDRLPAVTKFVFGVSAMVSRFWLPALVLGTAGVIGVWHATRTPSVRARFSEFITRAFVIGPLIRLIAAGRFCRMLGTMIGNGVLMLQAMEIARGAAGNAAMERAIAEAAESVREGAPLHEPLARSRLFDDDIIEMIAVAEEANNLDAVLVTIADTIEARIDRLLSSLVRLIEPVMLIVLAGIVVVVAAALILPITQLSAAA